MTLTRRDGDVVTFMPVLCDCWACELCGVRRAAWLKRQIGSARTAYKLDWFWTLTIWTESCTAPDSFRNVKTAWHNCHRGLTKVYGHFSYVWTVEATKRGYAHLHLLAALDVSRLELSNRWKTATGGSFIVDVQPVASERAANYLAKYCTQQATLRREPEWGALKNTRVFSKSRDVQFEPFRSPSDDACGVLPVPYWDLASRMRREASVLSERRTGIPCLQVQVAPGLELPPNVLAFRR